MSGNSTAEKYPQIVLPASIAHRKNRVIDPLAYSQEFERALEPSITLLQASLDYVSSQLQSLYQRRVLTRLEHKTLAQACLAFERGKNFNLQSNEIIKVARSFIMLAIRKALEMLPANPADKSSNSKNRLETILKGLGVEYKPLLNYDEYLEWDNQQNLNDLLDIKYSGSINLKPEKQSRKLHFMIQLSVFTSTPKEAGDYPLSIVVSPEEYFSINSLWSKKPELWDKNAYITPSGKLLFCKSENEATLTLRRNIGSVADLYLMLAKMIGQAHAL